jgi:hypothetical protein
MTPCDDDKVHPTTTTTAPCDCEGCQTGDLPVNPFVALRVAFGMLLGEEDFRTLMGNPRGKQMLHSAWLHGSGVVWGYEVRGDGVWNLTVGPGLLIDGIGRELLNEATKCLDVRELVGATQPTDDEACATRTVTACLVAEFDMCLTAPVPTLADPCDVTRKHDDYSRVIERVKFELREGCCPQPARPYHRVRVLLGLDTVGQSDEAGQDALAARRTVATVPADERPQELLRQFRRLAASDVIDLGPAREPGDCYPTLFPVAEDDSATVLACIEIDVRDRDGCAEITDVRIDPTVRTALVPTATIQELVCGLAPSLIGDEPSEDAGGPRVIGEEIRLSENGLRLDIPVTAPIVRSSARGSVGVTSLSADSADPWVVEDLNGTSYEESPPRIVVNLADRPAKSLIRIVVKGTGPKPVMGASPAVPLAGLVGGPPGSRHDGHDAVWVLENPLVGHGDYAAAAPAVEQALPDDTEETGR